MAELPSSRDSLLVRNTDTTRLRLTGDIVRAKQYIGVAQTYMGWLRNILALGSVNHGARHLRLDNGVKIRMLWDGTLNIIDIFVPERIDDESEGQVIEIFLESGWVNIGGNIYPIDEPKPAMPLFYSDPLLEQYDLYADNEDIRSIGKHPLASMPWLDEFEMAIRHDGALIGYLAQVREYLDTETGIPSESFPEGDIQKRVTWLIGAFLNAGISTQAGKFKLLLQAQMGRNDEQGLSWVSTFAWSEPTIESTYGLYTTAEYDYFVVRAGKEKMEYSPVVFRPAARRLQKLLVDNPTLDKRTRLLIESYLLSLAEKTQHDFSETWPAIENQLTVAGTPYYYGWKMNWQGNEWAAVCKEGIRPTPDSPRVLYWEGYRYLVALSEQRDEDNNEIVGFILAQSEAERVAYTPKINNTVLWYPDPIAQAMLPFVFETQPLGYTATIDADAPVYCWYDDQDRLNLIRHKLEQIPAASFTVPDFANSNDLCCAPGKDERLDLESHNGGLRGGFYLQQLPPSGDGMLDADETTEDQRQDFIDNPYIGDTVDSGYRRLDALSDFSQILEVVQRQEFGPIALVKCGCVTCDQVTTAGVMTDSTRVAVEMYRYDITNAQQRYISGLVIPFLTSEAAYFAKRDSRSGDYLLTHQLGSVYGSIYFYDTGFTCYHQMFWHKNTTWGEGTIISTDLSYSGHVEEEEINFTLAGKATFIPDTELTEVFFSYREQSGASTSEAVVTYFPTESEVLEASEESLGILATFFAPNLYGASDRHYGVPITTVEGIQRALYYTPNLKTTSSAANDENLPASNFNGLFVGNA